MAKKKEKRGSRVWVEKNKTMINRIWWYCDQEERVLKDRREKK